MLPLVTAYPSLITLKKEKTAQLMRHWITWIKALLEITPLLSRVSVTPPSKPNRRLLAQVEMGDRSIARSRLARQS